jgi:hypothetical protein
MKDPILFWNHLCNEANRFDHTAPMKGSSQGGPARSSRATAIVHLAMHDAYFGVAGGQALYLSSPPLFTGAPSTNQRKQSSAVTGAAHATLAYLYPEQSPKFLSGASEIAAENEIDAEAYDYGRAIAQAILAIRNGDNADPPPPPSRYVYSHAKLKHRADPLNPGEQNEPLGANWGRVKPFAIQSAKTLKRPFPLTSTKYEDDHKEVLEKGGAASQKTTTRTIDETLTGLYWAYDGAKDLGTPPRLYNQIVRVIAEDRKNTWADNARLFALINAAMGDAGIYAWYYKYEFDLWRPVIGVREFDKSCGWDAKSQVPPIDPLCDPFWRPLGAPKTNDVSTGARSFTPPFPAYPSGHATFGAAVFEIVRLFYNQKAGTPYDIDKEDTIGFSFVSAELDGISTDNDGAIRTRHERKYKSMSDAMFDNAVSRVFLGVHWRFDGMSADTVKDMLKNSGSMNDMVGGVPLGRDIAKDIFDSGLKQTAFVIP